MTQNQRIMKYINNFGSITTMQAFTDLGIVRLGARISELRQAGQDIRDEFVTSKNRYGEPVTYKKYFLGEQKNAEKENKQ